MPMRLVIFAYVFSSYFLLIAFGAGGGGGGEGGWGDVTVNGDATCDIRLCFSVGFRIG